MRTFHGLPVSPGYGRGTVFVYRGAEGLYAAAATAHGETPDVEERRFAEAVSSTGRELRALQRRLEEQYGSAEGHILGAQLLMLEDPLLVDAVRQRVREDGGSAEAAVNAVVRRIEEQLAAAKDPYLRERAIDAHDVGARILRHLADRAHHPLANLPAGAVIVADHLAPSDTVFLDRGRVGGMVTQRGSDNSHAAILARAAGIPAVTQVPGILTECRDGDPITVDGVAGLVILHPEAESIAAHANRARRYRASVDRLREKEVASVTRDGVAIRCMANVGRLDDLAALRGFAAEGIGLLRTEFLLLSDRGMASEAEQADVYGRFAAACKGFPVTIRTLDLAPDKLVPLADDLPLAHASIGERGVHYSLSHPEIFRPQLRAIVRAAAHGNVRILLPMVTGVAEIRAVRGLVEEVRAELAAEGSVVEGPVPVGAMIETPPAVLLARDIVAEADFTSIGSNDLLYYLFAADRQFRSAAAGSEFEPSLLRAIAAIVRAGEETGREVGLCGEMAGSPEMTILLVGLGLRSLSMSPQRLAEIRYNVREIDAAKARGLAEEVLRLSTAEEIRRAVLALADPWHRMLAEAEE